MQETFETISGDPVKIGGWQLIIVMKDGRSHMEHGRFVQCPIEGQMRANFTLKDKALDRSLFRTKRGDVTILHKEVAYTLMIPRIVR